MAHQANIPAPLLLLNIAGEEATTVASTFGLSDEDEFDYLKLVEKFKAYAAPEANETYVRFIFNRTKQQEGETFDHFLTEAKKNIKNCGFDKLENSLLRDKIVEGIRDKNLQQALLKNNKLTLEVAINECRAAEISKKYSKKMQETEVAEVNAIRFKSKKKPPVMTNFKQKPEETKTNYKEEKCRRCGYQRHAYNKCPAVGKTCANCGKPNHFAAMCDPGRQTVRAHEIQTTTAGAEDSEEEYQVLFSDCVETVETSAVAEVNSVSLKKEYRQRVKVENTVINFKLDPGSASSILSKEVFDTLKINKPLKKSNIVVKPYGNNSPVITVLGQISLKCKAGGQERDVEFLITDDRDRSLFGIRDCEKFGMIERKILEVDSNQTESPPEEREEFIKKNEDVFKGIGSFPGTHPILIRPDAQQVIRPAIRRPKVINDKLVPALQNLEAAEIIAKVEHLTPESWVSNIVVVTKPNGDIRICLDPVDLNMVIIKEP
ncbi:uncharacterized protein LOC117650755 [Thrips palmi]|uniref:Uncharacterized protein LOC117650755 n=1 Tax=Thrips palmi TaxID=161013 RepID=A0A6P8ZXV8_THRPL|nr:uncharacterized protein LOC117650755 [Thrips palmi]